MSSDRRGVSRKKRRKKNKNLNIIVKPLSPSFRSEFKINKVSIKIMLLFI